MTRVTPDGRIEFRFYRPNSTQMQIAGDFNGWNRAATAMEHEGEGWWTATLDIEPGDYRFRYYADNHWYTDFAANGVEQTKLGWNSILIVSRSSRLLIGQPLRIAA